ncbi:adenine-specific DNA-methyltransferase [Pasteurella testudinis DSM 23072]|uniref:site-specific DNA-methyltransferase (adenine-specific) n=1 Tax=Pasteurella testudinis DSM 23072 TaxID=1122938 RepID=A0A1W1VB40_9PAST|nr:site-specific DNA-methyltransferase [Pasteurella testudinis]SMB90271.1 adenine-specific DNA-methyltransferase [Pasteurella testudinis DSM 23072]SUB51373.1 type III restriction-modification system EcoP15I [Pasteurella testudinis]
MIRDQILGNETVQPNTKEIETLKATFPQFFDESGQFLQDRFNEMLKSNDVVLSKEGYELKFLGKSYSRYLSSTATETFVAPLEEDNAKPENKGSENLYIIGDNLDALKHLLNSYSGKIKCIYIDPPYNTGLDGFVYPDNFKFDAKELSKAIGIEEEEADRILNLAGKSSHSAWLTFMYPRLILARELLSEDGVIFISIDDNEQANLKMACDEIFGEENFVSELIWSLGTGTQAGHFVRAHENILCYFKNKTMVDNFSGGTGIIEHSALKKISVKNPESTFRFPAGTRWDAPEGTEFHGSWGGSESMTLREGIMECYQGKLKYDVVISAGYAMKTQMKNWFSGEETFDTKGQKVISFYFNGNGILRYEKERSVINPPTVFSNMGSTKTGSDEVLSLLNGDFFDFPKPTKLINSIVGWTTDENSTVLDFFSGSATTAHAVMQLNAEDGGNRKYIMVQLPEVIKEDKPAYQAGYRTIDEIGRERIRRAAKKIQEDTGAEIDYGFKTFKLEPVKQDTLNKMIDFDPVGTFLTEDMVSVFDTDKASGKNSILATWLNEDGYGLTAETTSYALNDYKADLYQDSFYIINEGLHTEDVMELVKRLETMELDINRVVVYPYSIEFSVMHELKKNIKNLRNNKSVEVIERY